MAEAATLFREYAASLGFELAFQGFDAELAGLPGAYGAPAGAILIAWEGAQAAGCVALRPRGGADCEMKRFYVRAGFRGRGVGRRLAEAIIETARRAGYVRMLLDTAPSMHAAIALYESLGFRETRPYIFNPLPGARFFELLLNE